MKLTDSLYFYPERGMLDANTYLIRGDSSIIIDVGSPQFLRELISDLKADGIQPEEIAVIANTHLHGDHCWANEAFKKFSPEAKIILHPLQKKFYDIAVDQTARFFGLEPVDFREDALFESDRLVPGDREIQFIPAPGHSPDSVCFYYAKDKALICGDVIFSHNTGRVDLPGGNADQLRQSIGVLSELDIEYLLPGHMNIVTGAERVRANFELVKEQILEWL